MTKRPEKWAIIDETMMKSSHCPYLDITPILCHAFKLADKPVVYLKGWIGKSTTSVSLFIFQFCKQNVGNGG